MPSSRFRDPQPPPTVYEGPDRRTPAVEAWHLDRKVPITLIGVLVVQLASGVWFASKLDARIAALEAGRADQHERDDRQDRQVAEALALIRAQLDRMDTKLDRIVEGGRK